MLIKARQLTNFGVLAVATSFVAACASSGGAGLMPPSGDQPTVRHTVPFPTQAELRARALGELSQGRVSAAEASIRRALVHEPEDFEGLIILARILRRQGLHEDALRLYRFVYDASTTLYLTKSAAKDADVAALAAELRETRFEAVGMTIADGRLLAAASWLAEDVKQAGRAEDSRREGLAADLAVAWLDAGAPNAGCEAAGIARGRSGRLVAAFCAGRGEPAESFVKFGRGDGIRVGAWLQAAGRGAEATALYTAALADGAESSADFAAAAWVAFGSGDDPGAARYISKAIAAEEDPGQKRALFLAGCHALAVRPNGDAVWTVLEDALGAALRLEASDAAIALAYFATTLNAQARAGGILASAVGDTATKRGAAVYEAMLTAGAWDVVAEWAAQPKAAGDATLALARAVAVAADGEVAEQSTVSAIIDAAQKIGLGPVGQLMAGQLRRYTRAPSPTGASAIEALAVTARTAEDYVSLIAALPSTRERLLALDLTGGAVPPGVLVAMLGELEAGAAPDGELCLSLAKEITSGRGAATADTLDASRAYSQHCFGGQSALHFAAATRLAAYLADRPATQTPSRRALPWGLGGAAPQMQAWRQDLVASTFGLPSVLDTGDDQSSAQRLIRPRAGLAATILGDLSRSFVAELGQRGARTRRFVAGTDAVRLVSPEQLGVPVVLASFAKGACADYSDDICARYLDALIHMQQREVPGLARPVLAELGAWASERGLDAQALALTNPPGRNDWNSLAIAVISLTRLGRTDEAQAMWRGLLTDRRIGADGLSSVGRALERRGELALARELAIAEFEARGNRAGAISRVLDLSWRLGDRQFMVDFARAASLAQGQGKDIPTLAMRRLIDAGMYSEALGIVQAMAASEKKSIQPAPALVLEVALVARDVPAIQKAIDGLEGYARRSSELVQIVNAVISRGFDKAGDAIVARLGAELSQSAEAGLVRVVQILAAGRAGEAAMVARELLQGAAWPRELVASVEAAFLEARQPTALAGVLASAPGAASRQGVSLARALSHAGDLSGARTVLTELDTSSGAARELVGALWRDAGFHTIALAALPTHENLWGGDVPKEVLEALFVSAAAAGLAPPFVEALEAASSRGRDLAPETLTALSALARRSGLPDVAGRLSGLLAARSGADADAVERAVDATRRGDTRAATEAWIDRTDVLAGAVAGRGGQPVGVHVALADTFARIAALGPRHTDILGPILGVFEGRLRKGPEGDLVDVFRAWRAVLADESPSSVTLGRIFADAAAGKPASSAVRWRAAEAIVAELVDRGLVFDAHLVAKALASNSPSGDVAVASLTTAARAGYPEEVLALLEAPTRANLTGQGWGLLGALTNVGMPHLAGLVGRSLVPGARTPAETNVLASVGAAIGFETIEHLYIGSPREDALWTLSDTLALQFARGDWAAVLGTPSYFTNAAAGTNSEDAERVSRATFVAGTSNQRLRLLDAAQRSRVPSDVALTDLQALATLVDAPVAAGDVLERQLASRPADGALHFSRVRAAILTAAPGGLAAALDAVEGVGKELEPAALARIVDLLAFAGAAAEAKRLRAIIPAQMEHIGRVADLSISVAAGDRDGAFAALGGDALGLFASAREAVVAAMVAGSLLRTEASATVVSELYDRWQTSELATSPIVLSEAALRAALTLKDASRYEQLLAKHAARWPTATLPADILTALLCLRTQAGAEDGWAARARDLLDATLRTDLLEAHDMLTQAFAGTLEAVCGTAAAAPEGLARDFATRIREAFSLRDALPVAIAVHLFFGDASGAASLVNESRARLPRATETLLATAEVALAEDRNSQAVAAAERVAAIPVDLSTQAANASAPFSLRRAQAFRLLGEAARARGDLPTATRWLKAAQMTAPRTARIERALLQVAFARVAGGGGHGAESRRRLCRALAPTMLTCDAR